MGVCACWVLDTCACALDEIWMGAHVVHGGHLMGECACVAFIPVQPHEQHACFQSNSNSSRSHCLNLQEWIGHAIYARCCLMGKWPG